eukprot:scaffold217_cov341-Pavlova_lutheri.AAC.5
MENDYWFPNLTLSSGALSLVVKAFLSQYIGDELHKYPYPSSPNDRVQRSRDSFSQNSNTCIYVGEGSTN